MHDYPDQVSFKLETDGEENAPTTNPLLRIISAHPALLKVQPWLRPELVAEAFAERGKDPSV